MSCAKTIRKVAEILLSDEERRFVVVSAPGKRFEEDIKITDTLYHCFYERQQRGLELFSLVQERFENLALELQIDVDLTPLFETYKSKLFTTERPDEIVSMGEHLSAFILAKYLGWDFIDSRKIIKFNSFGEFDPQTTNELVGNLLSHHSRGVISGFYGEDFDGRTILFSRGGSDVTGSIIARGVKASVYENWTDVSGCFVADPKIVRHPKTIKYMSFKELRELSYMGATVIHPDSVFPVRDAKIPINVRNTFEPENEGTMIFPSKKLQESLITGIAGKKNFLALKLEKDKMTVDLALNRKLMALLEKHSVKTEHLPRGVDSMTVIIKEDDIVGRLEKLFEDIEKTLHPDKIEIEKDLALVAVVGEGVTFKPSVVSRLFNALSRFGIAVRMIDQGSSKLSVIIAVKNDDYEKTVNAIYEEFIC